MDQPGYGATQFGGWVVAQALGGLNHATLAGLRHGLWWFHGLLAISFVASIPYTKAAHMLTSFLSLRDPLAGRRLAPIPPERAAEPAGYGALADFSPLHLLQLDACTKCGKCHEACPANATGRPLSPRDVILELREQSNHAGAGIGGLLGSLVDGDADGDGFTASVIGPDGVRAETAWSCMQCNACVEICPVGIEQAPIINQLRRRLVEEGELDSNLQSTLEVIHKSGNSFGENKRRRGRWAKELEFEVPDARKQPVDVLWFVGDYASFDPRSQRVTQSLARLLHAAGVDFGILYDGERNSGNDVRRVGEEGLFESLAEQNIAAIDGCDFQRIVTTDPHSLNTLRNEYPDLGGSWTVMHHTALLLELIEAGRLDVRDRLSHRVTYHDPCHLGALPGRVRRSPHDPGAARLHAGRDAAQPRQLVLLRGRRRAHLDRRRARPGAAVGEPHPRGGGPARRRAVRRRLPQGRDDVRGRDQDLRQRRAHRAARADRADRGGAGARRGAGVGLSAQPGRAISRTGCGQLGDSTSSPRVRAASRRRSS